MTVIEHAPAKINLGLKILYQREDGYHNILSIFQTVNLYDDLEITFSENPGLSCVYPDIPIGSGNLVVKAENLFREQYNNIPRVHFTLTKRIPLGGGLAGGSSDAAATLRGLRAFHGVDVSDRELEECACKLGSDVPFLMKGGTAVVSGRGEVHIDVTWPFNFTYVLIYPNFAVSTTWAYENIEKIGYDYDSYQKITEKLITNTLEPEELFAVLENDFEDTIFKRYPNLRTVKTQLIRNGARSALLTGSGSTMLGVFDDEETARHCVKMMKPMENDTYTIFIVKNVRRYD